ncbi:hypothetical protein D9M68_373580 [compost metagenome]
MARDLGALTNCHFNEHLAEKLDRDQWRIATPQQPKGDFEQPLLISKAPCANCSGRITTTRKPAACGSGSSVKWCPRYARYPSPVAPAAPGGVAGTQLERMVDVVELFEGKALRPET